MKNEMFDELLASMQEMNELVQGRKAPARVTEFPGPEVKAIREEMGSGMFHHVGRGGHN